MKTTNEIKKTVYYDIFDKKGQSLTKRRVFFSSHSVLFKFLRLLVDDKKVTEINIV